MKHILFILVVLAMFGCDSNPKTGTKSSSDSKAIPDSVILLIPTEKPTHQSAQFSDVKSVNVINFTGTMFTRIDRVMFFEDRFYIRDWQQQRVMVFDENGKYLFDIGRKGRGPGEHVNMHDFYIDKKDRNIVFSVGRPHVLIYFDMNGKYLSTKSLDGIIDGKMLGDEEFLYLENLVLPTESAQPMTIFNKKELTTVDEISVPSPNPYSTSPGKQFSMSNNRMFWTASFDYTIRELINGKCYELYTVDFGDKKFPEQYLTSEILSIDGFRASLRQGYIYGIANVCDTKNYMFFSTNQPGFYFIDKKLNTLEHFESFETQVDGKKVRVSDGYLTPIDNDNRVGLVLDGFFIDYLKSSMGNSPKSEGFLSNAINNNTSENPMLILLEINE